MSLRSVQQQQLSEIFYHQHRLHLEAKFNIFWSVETFNLLVSRCCWPFFVCFYHTHDLKITESDRDEELAGQEEEAHKKYLVCEN